MARAAFVEAQAHLEAAERGFVGRGRFAFKDIVDAVDAVVVESIVSLDT